MDFYHIFNRGVEKRKTFLNDGDYLRFIHDLYVFNDEKPAPNYIVKARRAENRQSRKLLVYIHAFCLMPNHYHMLLSPVVENGISLFIQKLAMGYAKYFNEKYSRSGSLWQGKYKKKYIEKDAHFLYIPYYIHLNPLDLSMPEWRKGGIKNIPKAIEKLKNHRWSSHLDYSGTKNFPSVLYQKEISEILGSQKNYLKQMADIISNPEITSENNDIEYDNNPGHSTT